MSRVDEILGKLRNLKVKIWVDGENLRIQAPVNTITQELRQEITQYKTEITQFLKGATREPEGNILSPQPRPGQIPLSLPQERLWFLHQLQPDSAVYNVPIAFHLKGKLNLMVLEAALSLLVSRHESLRTRFLLKDGRAYQHIDAPYHVHITQKEHKPEWQAYLKEEINRPFNLNSDKLFRALLLPVAEDDFVLLIILHHMVTDGWSADTLKREISKAYAAGLHYEEFHLPSLQIQYADYVLWQQDWIKSDEFSSQHQYWREQLKDIPAVLELPSDHPRPAVQTYRGATLVFPLDRGIHERLKSFSAEHGATLFTLLLSAFGVLLYRYSRQTQFAIGVPAANRSQKETEDLIGFFVNTLAVPMDLTGNPGFLDLLERSKKISLGLYQNQGFPFDRLVDDLHLERDLSRNALFQTMFALQNAPGSSLTLVGLDVEELFVATDTSKFDLTFFVNENEGGASLAIEFSADLFEPETIKRMAEHYQILLSSILDNPKEQVGKLKILGEMEQNLLLKKWNETRVDYPKKYIHELFEEQVDRTPDAIAVVFEDRRLTYRELNQRSNKLAHTLVECGVGPDVLVGVYMERSLEMVISLLGILKAGGAYVPIDPTYPDERIIFMLEDSASSVLLTQISLLPNLQRKAGDTMILCVDDQGQFSEKPDENPSVCLSGDNLAYMIYTSGSTGKPKGALNTHAGIFNRTYWMQNEYNLTVEDRVLQKTPFSFDVSVWEFFLPLMFGAKLVIARPEGHKDPHYLIELIKKERITTLHFVPSMLYAFLDTYGVGDCTSIRQVMCSGEALPVELANRFFRTLKADLNNLYGPTEAAVDVSYWKCQPVEKRHSIPLGRPVSNTCLYVLDENIVPTPFGVPGELHIAGVQVGRGYLNRPELTAEKFIPNPFGDGLLYKTGDLCRMLPDGNIEFLGRIDFQVKIRGFRIELGEIESVLGKISGVRQTIVTARKEANGQHRLLAYLTVDGTVGKKRDELISDIRKFLGKELPDYMIPAVFVILDEMPLNPNGKIDRKSLPEPSPMQSTTTYAPPQTHIEVIMAEIWCDLLRLPRVGVNDNFFELGGDSILSIQFISRAQTKGLYLTPRNVFEAQTIASLAQIAQQSNKIQRFDQGVVQGEVLLTPIQSWFFDKYKVNPHHFNQSVLLELDKRVDVSVLSRAFSLLLEHHDALRSRFEYTENGWRQWVSEPQDIDGLIRYVQFSGSSQEDVDFNFQSINKEIQTSLNITQGPLLRAALIDYGNEKRQKLLIVIHHLVIDFVSWQILISDLWSVYDQLHVGGKAQLSEKTSSYKAWADWLSEYAYDAKITSEFEYWLTIKNQIVRSLPMDRSENRRKNRATDMDKVTVVLSAPETKALLRDVQHAYHTHINEILLSALAEIITQWSGDVNLLVDMEGHGRESEILDISRTVGWFTTLFPVFLQLPSGGYGQKIQSVKEQMRRIPRKGMGYGLLRYLNKDIKPALSSLPRANIIFNYGGQLRTVNIKEMGDELGDRDDQGYLLNISGSVFEDRMYFSWTFSCEIYDRETIERLADSFIGALRNIIEHCLSVNMSGYTNDDFLLASLTQYELRNIIGQRTDILDIYPLSPMQSIILEQSLAAQETGVYFTQIGIEIRQKLDVGRFKDAWLRIIDRYEIFRTSFVWENLKQPMQVVQDKVELEWDEQDWRGIPVGEKFRWLDGLLRRERRKGFSLNQVPLVRFTLIRLDDDLYHFIWHCHHLLMDGWTSSILLREIADLYRDASVYLPEPRPYREYISWLLSQDVNQTEKFWRKKLNGFFSPSLLPFQKRSEDKVAEYHDEVLSLSEFLLPALQSFANSQRVTLNNIFQACWALTLYRHCNEQDVVFGVTVSGRSMPLGGIESRVGLYINTLPMRVEIVPDETVYEWLQKIMKNQLDLEQYAHTTPELLEKCTSVLGGRPIFNSAIRFQNYPLNKIEESLGESLQVHGMAGVDWWHYPLNVVIVPDSGVKLAINYDVHIFDADSISKILKSMEDILTKFIKTPSVLVKDLLEA